MFNNLFPLKLWFTQIVVFKCFVFKYYAVSKSVYIVEGNVSLLIKSGLSFILVPFTYLFTFDPS